MSNEGRLFGRRRRANVPAEERRTKTYKVSVSPSEDAALRARAEVMQVTVPRLMFEAAVSPERGTSTEWRAVGSELSQIRTLMGFISNNMNQLARFANTEGQFPVEAERLAAEYKVLVPRVYAALDRLEGK